MCGIAGVLTAHPGPVAGGPRLNAMLAAVSHRGPDDRGTWQSPLGHAAFAHARLSIIDPSPAGHQPMAIADGRFTITYNGEIYNFAELRASLMRAGVAFRSNSDTEVILRLYEADGPNLVHRLRGMFALAIWDEKERTCFLARDPFGVKPLYYHEAGGVLTFASEVRALVAAGVPPTVDATAAYRYFRSGSVPEPLTLIRGVRALEAGHYATWRDRRLSLHRYWDVHFPGEPDAADPVALARQALLDSVARHFVSDVPVGVFLSGGMDSTALVALARAQQPGELRTFSLTFPGSPLDEGAEARRTARHFNTTHCEWPVDGAAAAPLFDQFLAAADQPSIDGFNTFLVARLARGHDTKVVLSGVGGDELFGGYPSFHRVPRLVRLGRLAQLGGPVSAAALGVARALGNSRIARFEDLIASPITLDTAYAAFRGLYTRNEARLLTAHYVGEGDTIADEPSAAAAEATAEDTVSRLELTRYMRNQLLRDGDVMSMASGVEVRVPFVDRALFEALSRLPARQRLQPTKALLRQAVPEVPEWVANRPKRGFALPFAQWLAHDWAADLSKISPPAAIRMDTWYRKLAVLAFERWQQRLRPQHG